MPPGVYSLLMFVTGGAVMAYFGAAASPSTLEQAKTP